MKRYLVIVQHEVIIYAEDEKGVERNIQHNEFLKNRSNLRCTYITEIPMPEKEKIPVFEDYRKAPGA